MRLRLAVIVLLIVAVLAPGAQASHTMGHRYLVFGRLLDSGGFPVQNEAASIRLVLDGVIQATIDTTTDCFGDFENWDGEIGAPGGKVERQSDHRTGTPYVAFHYHDPELTNDIEVVLTVAGEEWKEPFNSKTRMTVVRHQLEQARPLGCSNYDEFNSTFTTRVSILSPAEMSTGDVEAKERSVTVELGGDPAQAWSGTTDFNGAYFGRVQNATLTAGREIHVRGDDIDPITIRVDDEILKYRRVDSVNIVGVSVGGVLSDFKNFGIGVVIIGFLVALFFAGSKLKGHLDERRLRETSTRRRFRRGDAP